MLVDISHGNPVNDALHRKRDKIARMRTRGNRWRVNLCLGCCVLYRCRAKEDIEKTLITRCDLASVVSAIDRVGCARSKVRAEIFNATATAELPTDQSHTTTLGMQIRQERHGQLTCE